MMLFESQCTRRETGDLVIESDTKFHWGVGSEYGRLTDVMLSAPHHLELVPCNAVSIENEKMGLSCCPDLASEQHAQLVRMLELEGVRCHLVPPEPGLPDVSFMRDAVLMTPWVLLGLRPAVEHRSAEVDHVLKEAARWGLPILGALDRGRIEGGDIALVRPGTVAIGYSGERTDRIGAQALAAFFEGRGWRAILTQFDPHFLHLDTHFTMISRTHAVAYAEAIQPDFLSQLQQLGIETIAADLAEVQALGSNLLSLGDGRLLSPAGNDRINHLLEELGYRVVAIEIDQFTRCGGGMHCLTMPLARLPG